MTWTFESAQPMDADNSRDPSAALQTGVGVAQYRRICDRDFDGCGAQWHRGVQRHRHSVGRAEPNADGKARDLQPAVLAITALCENRQAGMSDEALEWNYTHGTADPTKISPDSWLLQRALLNRPGNKDAMLDLLYDYRTNPGHYPQWQEYFRNSQPPTLIVWGRNDVIFPESGAHPYKRDLKTIDFNLLDTGHFALEDHSDVITAHIKRFTRTLT